jgi:hypothetical protein
MKNQILILAVALATLGTSCVSSRGVVDKSVLYAIDSSGLAEDVSNPGIYYKTYDTVKVEKTGRMIKGSYVATYKVIK